MRGDKLFSSRKGGKAGDLGSLISGVTVVGLAFAYAGPFIMILSIVASIIYGTALTLRLLTPKDQPSNLEDWG